MALRFKLLGVLQIENEAGEISPVMKSNKWCALLVYLFVTKAAQPREALADLLWDASSTAQSLQNLRALLARFRKWVPELEVTRKQIRYPTETAAATDYDTLIAALDSGDYHEIASALPLYQGVLLDGFYLEGAPRFIEWLLITREKLRQRVVGAFRQLCTLYQEQSEWVKGIALAQRWLALDELDEEALRHLLQLLAASGQIDIALQQYEVSRQRLWEELGVEPMDATQQLADQLAELKEMHGDGVTWDEVVGTPTQLPAPDELPDVGHLPSHAYVPYQRNPIFVGHQATLLEIGQALLPSKGGKGQRVVAITGMGGLGKTQLAVEFCYRYGRYFPGGVFWFSFANSEQVADEIAAVGGERGLALFQEGEQLTLADRVDRVQRAWREPIPRLLIFDNCEEEELLAKWLPVTGGCRVLLTSRRANWSGELSNNTYPLAIFEPAESVMLLQKAVPDLSSEDALEIANEVGHLPLALHLAGGFLRRYQQISPTRYLDQLRNQGLFQHPSLQGWGVDFSPTGHELNVARTFVVNLEQLSTADQTDNLAQKLLVRAACFAPGEPIQRQLLLATIWADEADILALLAAEDGLTRLVDLGFLKAEGSEWVLMHRLLATFVQESLGKDEIALVDVTRAVYEKIEVLFREKASLYTLVVAPTHVRHLISLAQGQAEIHMANLTHRLGTYLHAIADFEGSRTYLQLALDFYRQVHVGDHPDIARCHNSLGILFMLEGSYTEALPLFEKALIMWENTLGSHGKQIGFALNNIGYLLLLQGAYREAQPYLERLLVIFEQEFGHHPRTAIGLNNLGVVLMNLGNLTEARPNLERALEIREEALGLEHPHTAVSLQNMGLLFMKLKDFEQAQAYFERSLIVREKVVGNHPHTARSLNALGELNLATDNLDKAQSYLEAALKMQNAVLRADHPEIGLTLKNLGEVYWANGDINKARLYFEQARAILEVEVSANHPGLQQTIERLATSGESIGRY